MNNNLYLFLIIALVVIVALLLVVFMFFLVAYIRTNRNNDKKMGDIGETIDGMNELFHTHFKVTNETIVDIRRERNYWKKKASHGARKKSLKHGIKKVL